MALNDRNREALYQVTARILSREDTRAETDVLFNEAEKSRKADRKLVERLFIQTPGAEVSAPTLLKEAKELTQAGRNRVKDSNFVFPDKKSKTASVTKNVETFFEKNAHKFGLSEAQLRYPELLKAAMGTGATASGPAPMPSMVQVRKATPKSATGRTAAQSPLSGGDS